MSIVSTIVALSALTATPTSSTELFVGKPGLQQASVRRIVRGIGTLVRTESTGFYRVRLNKDISPRKAQMAFLKRGAHWAFDTTVADVDPDSLPSVRRHLSYMKASAKIRNVDEETAGVDFYEALEYYLTPRVDRKGRLDRNAYVNAANHRDAMPASGSGALNPTGSWTHVGPFGLDVPYRQYYGVRPLSGRKNDIAYAPSDPTILYAASAGGGVWKSTDSGLNWTPKSDGWKFLHTTTVAVSPADANLVLAGTGDYVGFFTAQTFGIMRSADGGNTWTNIGNSAFGDKIVSEIVFDKVDPNIVLATTGRGGGSAGDIWRSTDAGLTWARTNAADGSWDDLDIAGAPLVSGNYRFWACGGGTGGTMIAYSDDQGATWIPVAKPTGFSASESIMNIGASATLARAMFVIAPAADKIYKTENEGTTWIDRSNATITWSQDTYNIYISVGRSAPINGSRADGTRPRDVVYVGLISVYASRDDGVSWTDIARTATATSIWHNDQHCLTLHPTTPNAGMVGSDGGVASFAYNLATNVATFAPLSQSISDVQLYGIAVHPTNEAFVMGGTQDNATPASRGSSTNWANLYAGDGCFCGFNVTNPAVHYTTSQGGAVYRYDTDMDTSPTTISPGGSAPFVTPLAMGGAGFQNPLTTTSSKLRRHDGTTWIASVTTLSSNASKIIPSSIDGTRIYTVHGNGDIYMSVDSGLNLVKVDGDLPNVAVGAVYENPSVPFDVVAVLQTNSTGVGRAYRCTNVNVASPVWVDISGSGVTALPKIAFNTVAWDPHHANTLYAGSDIGCFMSQDAGATWTNMNTLGLPNTHVNHLVVALGGTYLYAGTFGRGMWRIPIGP